MADSDSFINEVTEEVRRDRLFAVIRRWGWLAASIVVLIVGGAAYLEYGRARDRAAAQAFGDALLTALNGSTGEDRAAALAEIAPATPGAGMILALLQSGEQAQAGDAAAAAARLRAAAEDADLGPRYRHLALLRAEMLDPSEVAEARLLLETLAAPGAPYAPLAQEQLALLDLREGDAEGAVALFRQIEANAASTPGLQRRAAQLIVAIEAGSTLVDAAPQDDEAPPAEIPPAEVLLDAPETDAAEMDTTDADAADAPETDAPDAPGTDETDAPDMDAADAPGMDETDIPETDAADASGTDAPDAAVEN